jgi:rhamnogalacturonan endolyase
MFRLRRCVTLQATVMKPLYFAATGLLALCGWLFSGISAWANLPGGGNGSGPAVTITTNTSANTITMSNGIVTVVISIYSSQILELIYNGNQVTGGGTGSTDDINWQGQAPSGVQEGANGVLTYVTNNGNFAEICIANLYANQGTTNAYAADAYYYFSMFRGSPGIYVTEDMERNTNAVAGGADIPSLTSQLWGSFNWLGQDNGRFMMRQSPADTAVGGINNSPMEVTLLTSGRLAGQFECKYDYAGDLYSLHFAGWASTGLSTNIGLWLIHPSREYFSGGPKHPEIVGQFDMINCTFKSVHFGFGSDLNFTNGETWSRVCGPLFFYCNQVAPDTASPQMPLYTDAAAQAAAEAGAWPYSWFTADTNYAPASGRGAVTGQLVINDSGNPNASAAGMWVGVEQQPSSSLSPPTTDFQFFGKNLQFWVQTDTNGNFTIPNVYTGTNYTLLAFGPGAIGLYQSQSFGSPAPPVQLYIPPTPFAVTVTGGQTNNLGNVTWAPTRVGATVWEMGVPDRDTTEFRHGADYWHGDLGDATNFPVNWAQWQDYNLDYPTGVNFTVGQSRWSADWDYAQPTSLDPTTGNLNGTTQNIFFNLAAAPANSAQASIYFAISGDYQGPVEVTVNGTLLNGTGFFPYYSSDPMIRMESHGIFCDYRLNFAGNLLKQGQNEIQLNMRKGGYFSNGILYDYIRLELTGYIPPAPAGLTAIAGNGLVVLDWPASSGATSYTVSRSMTSGGGYSAVATNVIGPVVGSDVPDATYTDNSAVNGTIWYYVVTAVNPNGSSANSVEAAATPSVSTPPAPSAPTGLSVTPGNLQATLTWNASPGAATYIIQRTVITGGVNAGDPGAETATLPDGAAPTNIVNSFVTTTNYTDTGLANNVAYAYAVSAANASGQSAASAPVSATPSPSFPTPPTGLAATVSSNQVTLSWNPVPNAEDYWIQTAASPSGPYSPNLNYAWWLSTIDVVGAYNTTFYFEVASANLAGISAYSSPIAATTTPAPPAPVTAVPGNAQIFVDWGDSAGATNYVLQRSLTSGGPYMTIVATNISSYLDTGLANGTTYYYVVYAVGPNGTSPLSVETTATPSATPQMIKSDTTTMDTAADWSGVTPVAGAVGLFNNIISPANEAALTLGGNVTVGGIIFTNNLNGPVTVGTGNTLTLGSAGLDMSKANQSVTFNNAISLAAAQVWNVTNNPSLTVNGTFTSASNNVIKTGGGTLYLGVTANDTGADIQVNSGAVQANASSGITISLNGGTFDINVFDSNPINVMSGGSEQNVGGNRTWAGNLTGSGPLTVIASSTHTWSGNNSAYAGTITLQGGGALRLSALTAVSSTTAYNFSGGTMNANASGLFTLGSLSGTGTINTAAGENFSIGTLGASTVFSGVIAGAGFVQKAGGGTLTLSGANTYSGGTIINSGVLQIGGGGTTGTPGTGNITNNATLVFDRADSIDDTGLGVISGTGILEKLGAGRLAFTKSHTYLGATLVESGVLALTNAGAIGNSPVLVLSAGALLDVSGLTGGSMTLTNGKTLSGVGSVKGNFGIGSGAVLSPGMNGIGTLTFSNSLTLAAGGTNIFAISNAPLTNDIARIFGALTNGGTLIVTNAGVTALTNGNSFRLFNAVSYSGGFAKVILPTLPAGLAWNTNALNTNGVLSAVALTSPAITSCQTSGSNLLISGGGGTANWPYLVLMTTNLPGNWTPVATNWFDASGNFSIILTNAISAGPGQSFYKLQLQ